MVSLLQFAMSPPWCDPSWKTSLGCLKKSNTLYLYASADAIIAHGRSFTKVILEFWRPWSHQATTTKSGAQTKAICIYLTMFLLIFGQPQLANILLFTASLMAWLKGVLFKVVLTSWWFPFGEQSLLQRVLSCDSSVCGTLARNQRLSTATCCHNWKLCKKLMAFQEERLPNMAPPTSSFSSSSSSSDGKSASGTKPVPLRAWLWEHEMTKWTCVVSTWHMSEL